MITIEFDGDVPTVSQIEEYVLDNHPSSWQNADMIIDIDPPTEHRGLSNPGIVTMHYGK